VLVIVSARSPSCRALLNSSDAGEDSAIGHLYMLARTFRQMLVILEKNVRDSRAIWQALWQGSACRPSPPDILSARRAATKAAASSPAPFALLPEPILNCGLLRPTKRLVLERLVYELASEPKPAAPAWASAQLSFEKLDWA